MEKCHGTILLTDEDHVDQTDPQPVPALKVGEMGYFFNVSELELQPLSCRVLS